MLAGCECARSGVAPGFQVADGQILCEQGDAVLHATIGGLPEVLEAMAPGHAAFGVLLEHLHGAIAGLLEHGAQRVELRRVLVQGGTRGFHRRMRRDDLVEARAELLVRAVQLLKQGGRHDCRFTNGT